jgi:hypothetical protein
VIVAHELEKFKEKLMAASTEGSSENSNTQGAEGENLISVPWIIDLGATNHMTGSPKKFSSYTPRSGREKVCIADGSSAPVMGSGTVSCTPSISLSHVLHVPKFPVNLL